MNATATKSRTYYAERLTRSEADRLYLTWHPKVEDEVSAARVATAPAPPDHEVLFAALTKDLLAADLWPTPAPRPAPEPEPGEGGPEATAGHAARFLREAERAYAQARAERALWLLQQAMISARAACAAITHH
ncbi:hypothetical protein [Catenulispora rubra]|uniref:hypothetical protein n=1 Tax=Catenulispora rubra TaxID=280293 RepID=UPI00189239DF|nr:hypothetical protein [Catenulispora rubra]